MLPSPSQPDPSTIAGAVTEQISEPICQIPASFDPTTPLELTLMDRAERATAEHR
jgi:hypothetical protein